MNGDNSLDILLTYLYQAEDSELYFTYKEEKFTSGEFTLVKFFIEK